MQSPPEEVKLTRK